MVLSSTFRRQFAYSSVIRELIVQIHLFKAWCIYHSCCEGDNTVGTSFWPCTHFQSSCLTFAGTHCTHSLNIAKVLSGTSWGNGRYSLLHIVVLFVWNWTTGVWFILLFHSLPVGSYSSPDPSPVHCCILWPPLHSLYIKSHEHPFVHLLPAVVCNIMWSFVQFPSIPCLNLFRPHLGCPFFIPSVLCSYPWHSVVYHYRPKFGPTTY